VVGETVINCKQYRSQELNLFAFGNGLDEMGEVVPVHFSQKMSVFEDPLGLMLLVLTGTHKSSGGC